MRNHAIFLLLTLVSNSNQQKIFFLIQHEFNLLSLNISLKCFQTNILCFLKNKKFVATFVRWTSVTNHVCFAINKTHRVAVNAGQMQEFLPAFNA